MRKNKRNQDEDIQYNYPFIGMRKIRCLLICLIKVEQQLTQCTVYQKDMNILGRKNQDFNVAVFFSFKMVFFTCQALFCSLNLYKI